MDSTLNQLARQLVAANKGILATDASSPKMDERLSRHGIEPNLQNRHAFRELLFTTPGLSDYISGIIIFDETIKEKNDSGIAFADLINNHGIIPGIKVDQGLVPYNSDNREKITTGLDGLEDRLIEYKNLGARFTKWRAVITIGSGLPTEENIKENTQRLVQYVSVSQQKEMLPIAELEVLMEGSHGLTDCQRTTKMSLEILFQELNDKRIDLSSMLLKTNMIVPGTDNKDSVSPEEIAGATITVLIQTVPNAIPGIVFLSGGQSASQATLNLNEICKKLGLPWPLSFSFERALEEPVLAVWQGKAENVAAAQSTLLKRARLNSLALQGKYDSSMEHKTN